MNVYIDCGACIGDTMAIAMEKWKDMDRYIGFEPNLENFKVLEERFRGNDKVFVHPVAAATYNGEIKLYCSPGNREGHSIYEKKWNVEGDPIKVKCIDFTRWLYDSFEVDDNITLKMNMEGAEYPVLAKLLRSDAINRVRALFVQWHNHKIKEFDQKEHNYIQFQLHKRGITACPFPK